jgi:3-dehydroquinate synthase
VKKLVIKLGYGYVVHVMDNMLNNDFLINYLNKFSAKIAIITDSNLKNLFARRVCDYLKKFGINYVAFYFPAGEINKTRETKQLLENQLLKAKFGRDTLIIAIGGGVVTDMAGFIASTYCRGVPVVYMPTTLLSMVDASIGGKTGVNTPYGKNMVGTFYQPQSVFIDFSSLKSLNRREFNNGLVEVIKHSFIADYNLFVLIERESLDKIRNSIELLTEIVITSCLIKKEIIEKDEKDGNIRQLLNFGHTIGHAIELFENYSIMHGEAVAIGMIVESYLASKIINFPEDKIKRLEKLLSFSHLQLKTKAFNDKDKFKDLLSSDKKIIQGSLKFILLKDIGKPYTNNGNYSFTVPLDILDETLEWAKCRFN